MLNDLDAVSDVKVEEIRLKLEKITQQAFLPGGIKSNIALTDSFLQYVGNDLVVKLQVYIYGRQLDKKTIQYPQNWREALKERWFPARVLKRWPVLYTFHSWEVKEIYPDIPTIPGHESIKMSIYNRNLSSW